MPTLRQQKLAKKILENDGKPILSKAMKEVGYSDAYPKNPHMLVKTASWQELLDELIPNQKLVKRLSKLVNNKSDAIALRALDIAFKLKGKYKTEAIKEENPFADWTDEELEMELAKYPKMKYPEKD